MTHMRIIVLTGIVTTIANPRYYEINSVPRTLVLHVPAGNARVIIQRKNIISPIQFVKATP